MKQIAATLKKLCRSNFLAAAINKVSTEILTNIYAAVN